MTQAGAKARRIYSFANYFWFGIGTALMLLTPLAVVVVLNRAGTPMDVGLYALAYAVTAPMQAFLGMHARTFIAMDRLHGFEAADVAAQRVHMAAGLLLGAGAIAATRGFAWPEVSVFAAMCLVRTAEGFAEVSAGMLQRQHRPNLIALVYGVRAVAATAAFAWLYVAGLGLGIALTAMAGVSLTVFFVIDRPVLRRTGTPLPWSDMIGSLGSTRPLGLFRRFVPVGVMMFLSVAQTNLPRYVVEFMVGIVELGVFTSLSFVLYAVSNFIVPVYQMTVAPLGQQVARGDATALRHATRIVVVNLLITAATGMVLVLAVMLAGTPAMIWAFGPNYAGYGPLLIALGAGAAVGMMRSCLGFVLTGLDVIRAQSAMSVGRMALFGLLVVAGTGGDGVVGIAWGWTIASAMTTVAGLAIAIGRLMQLRRAGALVAGPQGA